MTATNHVLTGCLLAATVHNPYFALPAALLAHFALDALPHGGEPVADKSSGFARLKYVLVADSSIAFLVLLNVFLAQPQHRYIIMAGGILCASPDLLQIPRYIRYLRTGNTTPLSDWLSQFHSKIQWCERPWGYIIEMVWFIVFAGLLLERI